MKQNSNTDILIERLKQNQYESELERRKDADALFAAGCAEDNDTWKSLALYYLASERITAQDDMTLDHLLGEDIRDKVTGLLMMRPFLHLADEENKRRKEGKKFVLLFYNTLNFARYNYRFGLDEGDRLLLSDQTVRLCTGTKLPRPLPATAGDGCAAAGAMKPC